MIGPHKVDANLLHCTAVEDRAGVVGATDYLPVNELSLALADL